jgi:hypothetical protein
MPKLSTKTSQALTLLRDGKLISSGGGVTVTPLADGSYKIGLSDANLSSNNTRKNSNSSNNSSSSAPVPGAPDIPPPIPYTPPKLPVDAPSSGSYGGAGSSTQTKTKASGKDAPYDFNQRGWEWYINNF